MTLQPDFLILFACGAGGALVKDILRDNAIKLPYHKNGLLYLGCVGGIIVGALAGYLVDNDPITAFLGGYAGYQIIESLVKKEPKEGSTVTDTVTTINTTTKNP